MVLVSVFSCLTLSLVLVAGAPFNNVTALQPRHGNSLGQSTIILAPPSVWDAFYAAKFDVLIEFYRSFAKMILAAQDNVIVLVDKHTRKFFETDLPNDCLLEADMYDPFIGDYAPLAYKEPAVLYRYTAENQDEMFMHQVEKSMERFLEAHFLDVDYTDLKLDASNIVHNNDRRAIISERLIRLNEKDYQRWAVEIQARNLLGEIAILESPWTSEVSNQNRTLPLDRIMAFMDKDIILAADLSEDDKNYVETTIQRSFRRAVKILWLPMKILDESYANQFSTCGLYTTLLSTNKTLYVPAFGNDPENWKRGYSSIQDRQYHQLIKVNTPKQFMSINMPYSLCEMGASLKGMSWQISGYLSDHIVQIARMKAKIRKIISDKETEFQSRLQRFRAV